MNLASFGAPASKSYGSGNDSTTEFETWLTTKSNASVTFYTNKADTQVPTITLDWLNNFDVILLQDLRTWTFTADEVAAFQAWMTAGGGVMALSGYFSDNATEIDNTNLLLSNTGMSLLATEEPGQACSVPAAITGSQAICPNTKASSTSGKCYCWGNSLPLTEWNTAHAIYTTGNLKAVGAFRGRAVNPGTTGETVVSFGTTPVGATTTVGSGKVFIFGDEWVTYTSQWLNGGQATNSEYDPCWDEVASTSCLAGHVYQTMQFWYNSIKYVSPPTECDFVIETPEVIIPIQ
jgi:hypothetical protein